MRKTILKDLLVVSFAMALLFMALAMRAEECQYAFKDDSKKNLEKFEFSVFPNPFITATRFRIVPGNKQITELRVYDLLGKTIARKEISLVESVISYTIDLSDTDPGVYFCSVYEGTQKISTRKLVKAKP